MGAAGLKGFHDSFLGPALASISAPDIDATRRDPP